MLEAIENKLNEWWASLWAWCKNSGTIALARLTTFVGTATTFVAGMDWSPLWSFLGTGTGFTKQQLITIGIAVIGTGLTTELVRRKGTREVENRLIPKDAVLKKNAKK